MSDFIQRVIRNQGTSRRALGRLGAVLVGASAAGFMSVKAAEASHNWAPVCDSFPPACHSSCGTTVTGICCWFSTDSQSCVTYRCCDRPDLSPRPCMCRYVVGQFC